MKFRLILFVLLSSFSSALQAGDKIIQLNSPDKHISVTINIGQTISYQVSYNQTPVTGLNRLSLTLGSGETLGVNSKLIDDKKETVNKTVTPAYGMANVYMDSYNSLSLTFKQQFSIIFRVYNTGVAYRFVTRKPGKIKVETEEVSYSFSEDVRASMMKVGNFLNSYEEHYVDSGISFLDSGKIAALPLLVESKGIKIGITEADLLDYAGLYLTHGFGNSLRGEFPKYVLKDSVADVAF